MYLLKKIYHLRKLNNLVDTIVAAVADLHYSAEDKHILHLNIMIMAVPKKLKL